MKTFIDIIGSQLYMYMVELHEAEKPIFANIDTM